MLAHGHPLALPWAIIRRAFSPLNLESAFETTNAHKSTRIKMTFDQYDRHPVGEVFPCSEIRVPSYYYLGKFSQAAQIFEDTNFTNGHEFQKPLSIRAD